MANETNYDSMFGRMALEQGFCTDDELKRAFEQLKSEGQINPTTLHELMIELGFLTHTQAERLHKSIKESKAAVHQIPGYKIEGKLGAGAMAVVYKAKQISLNRMVAIKVLPKRFTQNPEYVERFYKEGQAAGKLNHPNIVQAVDVGEAGGYHYFVMEYVEGETIYEELAAGKIYREPEALDIVIQVAKALKHAHSVGLIHRDVKPKNIMLTKDGTVKLADMGLARETTDVELAEAEKGKAYGTPYYIAPEQIRGEMDIDGRADIYGLGATLYHMITGRVPFMADDPSVVMKKHLREELIPPDHINTSLTAGISEVVEVMMAKKKENRYGNCKELLEDLEAVREGEPPFRARTKFDVSALKQLSEGEDIEQMEQEKDYYRDEDIVRYKIIAVILGAALAISVLIIVFLLWRHFK
ncbi:MAG: protein kinase [Sedimentisphaerales bacterium]|nr:protein kinase [Sedimentisphaerales bacterium]